MASRSAGETDGKQSAKFARAMRAKFNGKCRTMAPTARPNAINTG